MDAETTTRILNSFVMIQEKVDGINIGVTLDQNARPLLINKNKIITADAVPCLKTFQIWYEANWDNLFPILRQKITLFGEYLITEGQTVGSEIPWILFDAFDADQNRFLSQSKLRKFISSLNLVSLPTLFEGIPQNMETIEELIGNSSFGNGLMEGVCLRLESGGFLKERFKFVRSDYRK
jgi:ATP-dependent RNA circularization protein (DNA/RNA ligase family)